MSEKQPARQKPRQKPSAALAVRPKSDQPPPAEVVITGLPEPQGVAVGQLGELATVGALGLQEVKLTDKEEAVLARPVNEAEILIKPDGTPYLSHPSYTRLFNEAFGRLGWSIVPTAKPSKTGNLVSVPYLFYVHGKAVAYAIGEQDYHETNSRQTFGDAVESTIASALRRCAKRMGVSLELWDKAFLAQWKAQHCVAVTVTKRGEKKTEWRRKVDPPLPGEGPSRHRDHAVEQHWEEDPGVATHTVSSQLENAPALITKAQQARLGSIAQKMGRDYNDVKLWLLKRWGAKTSAEIKQSDYAQVVRELESRGPLSIPGDGGE